MGGFITRLITGNGVLIAGGIGLLLAAVFWLLSLAGTDIADSALLFVAFLLISIAGLALAAAVFKALGHTENLDAFGLPSGSIRALIAILMLVLFVLFGLPFVQLERGSETPNEKPFDSIVMPCSAVAAEVRRLAAVRIIAIPDLQGCSTPAPRASSAGPGTSTTGVGPASAGPAVPGGGPAAAGSDFETRTAALKLYTLTREHSAARLEFSKQIMTAITAFLTTIVGFYFGSQSALAIVNATHGGASGGGTASPGSRGGDDGRGGGSSDDREILAYDQVARAARALGRAEPERSRRAGDHFKAVYRANLPDLDESVVEAASLLVRAIESGARPNELHRLSQQVEDAARTAADKVQDRELGGRER